MKKYLSHLIVFCFQLLGSFVYGQKVNVVFILADDLGYGDVGFTGQTKIQTPYMDRLAKEGIVFDNFYAGAPVCSPSRFALITGRNSGHATIRGNATIQGGTVGYKGNTMVRRASILPSDSTIANVMQAAGYSTALMGKWHIDGYDSLATPLQHGFGTFKGWLINKPATYSNTYWPSKWMDGNKEIDIPQNQNGKHGYYTCDIITDDALSYLKDRSKDHHPFFLMVNHSNPHSPLDAPLHPYYKDSSWTMDQKTYASMVTYVDESVSRIVRFLKESGLDKNTIVLFTSDNGPRSEPTQQLTEVAAFFQSGGKYRGYKRDLYEGGIHEPFFAWSQVKGFAGGEKVSYPAYFPDILPTLGGIARLSSISKYPSEGKDLSRLLFSGDSKRVTKERYLYWEFFEGGFVQAVRYGRWKAIVKNGDIALYDLEIDIHEDHNVALKHADVIKKIRFFLKSCRTESVYWPTQIHN